jgi:hypothetical protein
MQRLEERGGNSVVGDGAEGVHPHSVRQPWSAGLVELAAARGFDDPVIRDEIEEGVRRRVGPVGVGDQE